LQLAVRKAAGYKLLAAGRVFSFLVADYWNDRYIVISSVNAIAVLIGLEACNLQPESLLAMLVAGECRQSYC
jgi:hypothetical protein